MTSVNSPGLLATRYLLLNLTLRELRSRYKRSVLGWAWSMVNPIATMLIFSLVFRVFLKIAPPAGDPSGLENFPLFLLCGLLPWNFLANSLGGSVVAIVGNAGLIKKVYFPRSVLPTASVLGWNVNLLIEFGVLFVALMFAGNMVIPWIPVVALVVVLQTFFVLGIGLGLSALNVYFRDIQHFLSIALLMWFYATPIVYPPSFVPIQYVLFGMDIPLRAIYNLNPMVHFLGAYRSLIYDLRWPELDSIIYLVVVSIVSLALGSLIFRRFRSRFAEEL